MKLMEEDKHLEQLFKDLDRLLGVDGSPCVVPNCTESSITEPSVTEGKVYKNDFIRKMNRLSRQLKSSSDSGKVDTLSELVLMILQFQLYGVK